MLPNFQKIILISNILSLKLVDATEIQLSFYFFSYSFFTIFYSMDLNRQIKYITNTLEPEWQQTVVFMNCLKRTLKKRVLEVTVWDFDRLKMNDFMGQAIIHLGCKLILLILF